MPHSQSGFAAVRRHQENAVFKAYLNVIRDWCPVWLPDVVAQIRQIRGAESDTLIVKLYNTNPALSMIFGTSHTGRSLY